MNARQIPFDLSYAPALEEKDFVVGNPNRDALSWINRWPHWPGNALALFGPEGCGKSHLACVWRQRSGALVLSEAPGEFLFPDAALILESPSRWPEATLLHLLNSQREAGRFVLLLDRMAPARWQVALPDLASRLGALPAIGLQPPDDALLIAVMAKHFADRNQTVGEDALRYLALRVERSFSAAARIVAAVDKRSLAQRRPITLALVREAMAALEGPM
jgi:chromosomal replication initiation ATPase DnaA